MPKVSVVLPIYNSSQYLREALDSVVNQTLNDIEIICVNDGSTDNSLDIVNEYAARDKRIIVINKTNSGYGHSMNKGIDAAAGEYLGILESDDFLELTMFEDLYEIAVKNNLDTVKADFYRFTKGDDGNMNLDYIKIDKDFNIGGKVYNPSENAKDITNILVNTWAGIYRLSFLRDHNIRHNETPGASFQDNGFFWQVQIYANRAMLVNKPYYYCRRDNPNSSVKDATKVWAMSREFDFIRDILMRDEDVWSRFKYFYWRYKYWSYNFTESLIENKFKHDFIMRVSKEYNRALESEELSVKVFSVREWSKIQVIIHYPEGYLKKHCQDCAALENARNEIKLLYIRLKYVYRFRYWNIYLTKVIKKMME